jgi:ketosteroid isomerase-like protein
LETGRGSIWRAAPRILKPVAWCLGSQGASLFGKGSRRFRQSTRTISASGERVHEREPKARAGPVLPSRRRDARQPLRPPARGWDEVAKTQERGASYYRDGEIYDFETVAKYVTPELACLLWIERTNAKVGGSDEVTACDLRVTMVFRPEDGTWKVVHRHADPITTPQPAESVIQQ